MSRAKKILFLGWIGLTAILWQSIIANVKPTECKSLIANLPDNAGELRSRKARTALSGGTALQLYPDFLCAEHRRAGAL
jgi:hypothetical protein